MLNNTLDEENQMIEKYKHSFTLGIVAESVLTFAMVFFFFLLPIMLFKEAMLAQREWSVAYLIAILVCLILIWIDLFTFYLIPGLLDVKSGKLNRERIMREMSSAQTRKEKSLRFFRKSLGALFLLNLTFAIIVFLVFIL